VEIKQKVAYLQNLV